MSGSVRGKRDNSELVEEKLMSRLGSQTVTMATDVQFKLLALKMLHFLHLKRFNKLRFKKKI